MTRHDDCASLGGLLAYGRAMSESRCISCGRRKGRRTCPALAGLICPTCCGTKRLHEIACPSDCTYLATAQQHPPAVVQRRHEREARFLIPLIQDLSERQYRLFLFVQGVIARHRPAALQRLTDLDIADAVHALAATLETERRGIIYEHSASSLPAQRLEQDLNAAVELQRKNGTTSLDLDFVTVLQRTERACRDAGTALGGGGAAYLNLILDGSLRNIALLPGDTKPQDQRGSTTPGNSPGSEGSGLSPNTAKSLIVP